MNNIQDRERTIGQYVEAYNNFDVSKMIADFSADIVFENIQDGQVSMVLNGIEAFKNQAEAATQYFVERRQTIRSFKHEMDKSEIEIDYYGVAAKNFPNGITKGQEIRLTGKSVFEFRDGKIVRLTDLS